MIKLILCLFLLFNTQIGIASYYTEESNTGKLTANGEIYNENAMTCASYYYKFNTILKVTNLTNNKSVIVRVNDRGPNKKLHRIIDLSKKSFAEIANLDRGLIKVKIRRIK